MAEKTDQEIIEELGLEQENNLNSTSSESEGLEPIQEAEATQDENNLEEEILVNEDLDDAPVQKKKPKVFKYLIALIATLSIILTIGVILYMVGYFDEEKPKKEEIAKAQPIKIEKEHKIDIDDIDENKLNQKLKMLTKTEILNKEELEAEEKRIAEEKRKEEEAKQKAIEEEKRKEEERIAKEKEALEKEKQLLEERQMAIKKEQEEFLKLQEQIKKEFEEKRKELLSELQNNVVIQKEVVVKEEPKVSVKVKEENTSVEEIIDNAIASKEDNTEEIALVEENNVPAQKEEVSTMNANLFLPFINVAVIKGNLHKSYLDKVESIDKKISLCRDSKNRVEIYFGPYDSSVERNKVFETLSENGFKDSYLVDFTKEEYEKRCKY